MRGATGATTSATRTTTGPTRTTTPGPGRPPGPPPKAAGDFGIIAGLGRGMHHALPADAADAGDSHRHRGWRRGPHQVRHRAWEPVGCPCPGSRRTGCCPDAERRDGRDADQA